MTTAPASLPSCSRTARASGDEPIGCEIAREHFVLLETPLPWPADIEDARHIPQRVRDLVERFEHGSQELYVLGLAPDASYSLPGYTRILSFRRPTGAFNAFERAEYLVPHATVPDVMEMLCLAPDAAAQFSQWLAPGPGPRDLLVCTHGAQDLCCARYGYPAYRRLRERYGAQPGVRIWRSSHFGGHRFAPTMLEFPTARGWAWLDDNTADRLVERSGQLPDLYRHYRGCAGLGFFAQVAERAIFSQVGWDWLDYRISAEITSGDPGEQDIYPVFADDPPPPIGVRIDYRAPSGRTGSWWAEVVPRDQVTTHGECSLDYLHPTWRFDAPSLEHIPGATH